MVPCFDRSKFYEVGQWSRCKRHNHEWPPAEASIADFGVSSLAQSSPCARNMDPGNPGNSVKRSMSSSKPTRLWHVISTSLVKNSSSSEPFFRLAFKHLASSLREAVFLTRSGFFGPSSWVSRLKPSAFPWLDRAKDEGVVVEPRKHQPL